MYLCESFCADAGGDDFDNAIVQWLARTHLQGVDWRRPAVLSNLKTMAELAKVLFFFKQPPLAPRMYCHAA